MLGAARQARRRFSQGNHDGFRRAQRIDSHLIQDATRCSLGSNAYMGMRRSFQIHVSKVNGRPFIRGECQKPVRVANRSWVVHRQLGHARVPSCVAIERKRIVVGSCSNAAAFGQAKQTPPMLFLQCCPFSIMDRYRRARDEAQTDTSMQPTPENLVLPHDSSELLDSSELPSQLSLPPVSPTKLRWRRTHARGPIPTDAQFANWNSPIQPANPRLLTVALIGPPNAGKSSLLNALLGVTLSAVSNKVNTTRSDFRGVVTRDNRQLVFIDAPGIIESHPKKTFCRELVNAAWRGYEDADVGVLVVDTVKRPTQQIFNVVRTLAPKPCLARFGFQSPADAELASDSAHALAMREDTAFCFPSLDEMREAGIPGSVRRRFVDGSGNQGSDGYSKLIPIILCLNKVDLASHPKWIDARAKEFEAHGHFHRVFHISAKYQRGVGSLLDFLFSETLPRPWLFPSDLSDGELVPRYVVTLVECILRTYLFCWFNKDVPYRIRQQTVGWTNQPDGSVVIEQELLVATAQVAKMICGVRGRIVLQMRKNVTYKLERLWGHKVVLQIYVKVSQD
ncbi:hypothetical protein Esti_000460 [Eimeria stiedai]